MYREIYLLSTVIIYGSSCKNRCPMAYCNKGYFKIAPQLWVLSRKCGNFRTAELTYSIISVFLNCYFCNSFSIEKWKIEKYNILIVNNFVYLSYKMIQESTLYLNKC